MDEKVWISNTHLKVGFDPKIGGRATELYCLGGALRSHNLLWNETEQAEITGWRHGGMPLLFPFAGWIWDGAEKACYSLNKSRYHIPIHGFAHSQAWEVLNAEQHRLCLGLRETHSSLKMFPWQFKLTQEWELDEFKLRYNMKVENAGFVGEGSMHSMPVSMGLHPYFSCQVFVPGQTTLNSQANCFCHVTPEGKAGPEHSVQKGIFWDLSEDLHHNGILCGFSRGNERSVLKTPQLAMSIEGQGDTPSMCMITWSNRKNQFFCLEPWMGKPDALTANYGSKWLEEGASLSWSGQLSFETYC